ncbi:DNA polymerase III subunit tau [Phycisphaerae bacterium RAS2]|nr:DNA polymerase III subunit tau [Phycisphaerae bacterium RAS2]
MPFDDVKHQSAAMERVRRALQSGRMPHAYLFTGRPGVGRQLFAERLSQYLLCAARRDDAVDSEDGGLFAPSEPMPLPVEPTVLDACGACEDCRMFAAGTHPDYHPIYRGLNRHHPDKGVQKRKALEHSVEVIRHFLLDAVTLRPSRGRAKVFLVSEAERLSIGAQNAMLKTLEEPPGHSYLILIASSADELLPTTRSRCHHVAFQALPADFIVQELIARGATDPDEARFLAALSQGSLGAAMQLTRGEVVAQRDAVLASLRSVTVDPLGTSRQWQELAKLLTGFKPPDETEDDDEADEAPIAKVKRPAAPPKSKSENAVDDDDDIDDAVDDDEIETGPDARTVREGQRLLLAVLGALLGDALRIAAGVAPHALTEAGQARAIAAGASARRIGDAIRAVSAAERQLELNANVGLVFDALAIAMSRALGARAA